MNLAKLEDMKSKQSSHLHLYILTMKNLKEKIRIQSHSPLQQKEIARNKLSSKETKELHTEMTISEIYKQLKQLNTRKTNNPIKK